MPKKNWSQKEKEEFVKRKGYTRKDGTKVKGTSYKLPAQSRKKMGKSKSTKSKRESNPGLGKIDWGEAAKNLGGVAAGSFIGFAITNFIGDMLISKLPATVQGLGYALGGAGVIIAGHMLQRELKDWPVDPAFAAIAAPFALRTFASYNLTPLGVQEETEQMEGMGYYGRGRRQIPKGKGRRALRVPMGGSFARNPMGGSFARNPMGGSFARNPMAGTMIEEDPFAVYGSRGGHSSTL